jgi:hypothetical protein
MSSDLFLIRWQRVQNADTQPIPPYAAILITGVADDGSLTVTRPTTDGQTGGILFNGFTPIPVGAQGQGAPAGNGPLIAAYEQTGTGADPADGDEWGVEASSWYLQEGQTGFLLYGASDGLCNATLATPSASPPAGGTINNVGTTTNYDNTSTINNNGDTINNTGSTTNYNNTSIINNSGTSNYSSTAVVNNTGSTTNFNNASVINLAGPAINVNDNTTIDVISTKTWTFQGLGVWLFTSTILNFVSLTTRVTNWSVTFATTVSTQGLRIKSCRIDDPQSAQSGEGLFSRA